MQFICTLPILHNIRATVYYCFRYNENVKVIKSLPQRNSTAWCVLTEITIIGYVKYCQHDGFTKQVNLI